ncbi:MAG: TPM domain-containing protein [Bacteroidota bacterium]
MRKISLSALFLIYTVLALAQYTPESVPNTKLVNNSYVSNPDHLIKESTVAEIDSVLSRLEKQTSAQVAVVVLNSIGDASDVDFSQSLFNLWGIGQANSNGLLILVVDNPHVLRFHTGYGLEGALPDKICKDIQRDKIVPSFKEGDYDTGLLNGVNEVSKILTDPNYKAELAASQETDTTTGSPIMVYLMILARYSL